MRILISGATGMIGRALQASLRTPSATTEFKLPEVWTLVRPRARAAAGDALVQSRIGAAARREVSWDPAEQRIDLAGVDGFDAVVHLAGESIAAGPGGWSEDKRHRILESRRRGTELLAQALSVAPRRPRVLVCASGVGYYGATSGDAVLDETAPRGSGFLADVAAAWESAAEPARRAGIRTVHLRFGVVLARSGGVLAQLYWPYWAGLGGPVGPGSQWMAYISLDDAVRAIEAAIARPGLDGPVNAVAPEPATAADFARALGAAMHRPALLPLPAWAVRAAFGEMGEETLLASQRALPRKLLDAGFEFKHPNIGDACRAALLM